MLSVTILFASFSAWGCRTEPSIVVPDVAESIERADLVFVAHIGRDLALDAQAQEFLRTGVDMFPVGVAVTLPSIFHEFSAPQVLKGELPAAAVLRGGFTSCEVQLAEGEQWLIFTASAYGEGKLMPTRGSFKLDGSNYSRDRLSQLEAFLNLQVSITQP